MAIKRVIVYGFSMLALLFSCKTEVKMNALKVVPELVPFLDSFCKSCDKKMVHEIMVDKIDPETVNIYLYEGKRSILEYDHSTKVSYFTQELNYKEIRFNVLSGVEKFFFIDSTKNIANQTFDWKKIYDSGDIHDSDFSLSIIKCWLLKSYKDSIYICSKNVTTFPGFPIENEPQKLEPETP